VEGFLGKAVTRALKARGLTPEELAYKVLPLFLLDIIQRYLRVTVEGIENVPAKGPAIVIANHSGFMGFDALMISHQIFKKKKRVPRIITHKLWFLVPDISVVAKKLGLVPATFENGLAYLKRKEMLILFPEGEEGNFKPTRFRYRLRPFRRGFVRLALKTGAPIIPSIVIGAEETNITLSQIRWAKQLFGIIIPVPLNVVPLPAKWYIQYLPPIHLEKNVKKSQDMEYVTKLSRKIRRDLQAQMNEALRSRKRIFL